MTTPSQRRSLIAAAERQMQERQLVKVAMRVELARMYPGHSTTDAYRLVSGSPAAREQLVHRVGHRITGQEA